MSVSSTIFAVIVAVSNALVAIFSYMLAKHTSKSDKESKTEQKIENAKEKIDEACDHGTMSDLIDAAKEMKEATKGSKSKMKQIIPLVIVMLSLSGCFTGKDPTVESTKPWEGHYYTVEDAKTKISNASLDKDESIWVLSNKTLKRLLKDTRK